MNIPEELKLDTNMAVVFKKHSKFNGITFNAIYQRDDGTLLFFDTDKYHTNGTIKVAYKDVEGDL